MNKTFKFRIYPNKKQEVTLLRTLDTCRHIYNDALSERKRQAELNKLERMFDVFPWGKPEWINKYDQMLNLTANKTDTQKKIYSQVLQNVIQRVNRSFQNMFNSYGYPRFQGRNRYNSFTYPQAGFKIEDNKLKLSKIGEVRLLKHRQIEGKIKTCTIKKDIDQWYVSFVCKIENPVPIEIKNKVGIDVGLTSLITLSNGEKIEPPKFLGETEDKLMKEQKRLSLKKKGSNNRNKQRIKLARVHRKIKNQRKDFNHRLSRTLVNTYDLIRIEDLQIKNMVQNHHLAKSISDASWSQLIQFTSYKAEWAGKIVELVNPKGTSQTCSGCGKTVQKNLSERVHNCHFCGLVIDRDHNAAINILNRNNMNTHGLWGINACGELPIKDSMKQEALFINTNSDEATTYLVLLEANINNIETNATRRR